MARARRRGIGVLTTTAPAGHRVCSSLLRWIWVKIHVLHRIDAFAQILLHPEGRLSPLDLDEFLGMHLAHPSAQAFCLFAFPVNWPRSPCLYRSGVWILGQERTVRALITHVRLGVPWEPFSFFPSMGFFPARLPVHRGSGGRVRFLTVRDTPWRKYAGIWVRVD